MNDKPVYPEALLPSNMFSMKRSPILWIGSGMSKRYVEGFQTWDELLMGVASRFGVDSDMYMAIRMGVMQSMDDPSPSEDRIAMRTASQLSSILIRRISNGEVKASDILDEQDLNQYRHGVDPLKLMVCSGMRDLKFRQDMGEEIECFKALKDSVPAVITTNYDTVVETLFNNEFKVFNDIDEYYGSNEFGIGEIHKIHGTIKAPRSIVLTEEDYDRFHQKSTIVSSKIVSMMCESPLLIMGYSMEDRIIREIIGSMFSCFSREKATAISKNIVCIQYSKGAEPSRGIMQVESSSGLFQIQTLILDDYLPILRDISRFRMTFSVMQMRMLRKMMVDISLSPDPNNDPRLAYAGIEGIDEVDPDRTVIALTSKVYIDATKSFKSFSIDDVIRDVLYDCKLPAESMIDIWFEANRLRPQVYLPIFDYLASLNRGIEDCSERLCTFIHTKNKQYQEFFETCDEKFAGISDIESFERLMKSDKGFKRPDLIIYAFRKNLIDRDETIDRLRDEFKRNDCKSNTSLKRAVTYVGYRKMYEE